MVTAQDGAAAGLVTNGCDAMWWLPRMDEPAQSMGFYTKFTIPQYA